MRIHLRTYANYVIGGILVCGSVSAFGQSKLDSIQHLDEVVVTAKQTFKEVIPSQRLSGKELKSLNSVSVADALRYFAGVQLKDYGGIAGIKTVDIRSMGTNHMGVFYDGVELSNAQNGQIDLGQYSLDLMEELSLYNGQKSEIFQPAKDFGSSGSIYLWTRNPKFKEGKNINTRFTLKTGSFGLINPSVLYEQKLSDKVRTSFNAEWTKASGKYKFRYRRVNKDYELLYDTTAIRENGDINAIRLEGGAFGDIKNGDWRMKAYTYNSERGIPGAVVNNVWRRGERMWDTNSFLQGNIQKGFAPWFTTRLTGKYAHYRTHYQNGEIIAVDNLYKQKEAYFSSANLFNILPGWEASVSYDFNWNYMNSDNLDGISPSRFTHLLSAATAFSWGILKVQASALGTFVRNKVRTADQPATKNIFTPAIFASIRPFKKEDFTLRVFYKKAYRMPTFNDLYYADMGNALLKPEITRQYNAGFAYTKPFEHKFVTDFRIQADVYYNLVKDKIIAFPKSPMFRWTMLNLGKVDIRGVDASSRVTVSPLKELYVTFKVQYTYQEAIDISNTAEAENFYGHQIPYIPWHSGSFIGHINYKTWSLNYSFIYVGERYSQQENIVYNHLQPWYTSDMSIMKTFKWGKYDWKLTAEINNLLGQDYDVIINYPMPMRNYRISAIIEF